MTTTPARAPTELDMRRALLHLRLALIALQPGAPYLIRAATLSFIEDFVLEFAAAGTNRAADDARRIAGEALRP